MIGFIKLSVFGIFAALVMALPACSGSQSAQAKFGQGGDGPDLQSGGDSNAPEDEGSDDDGGTIDNDDGDDGSIDLRTPAHLVVSPVSYDFQVQSVGSYTHKYITIQNTGQKPAENLRVQGLAAPYQFRDGAYPGFRGTCGTRLTGGASCQIVVTFHPTALGRYILSSTNVLYDGDTNNITVNLPFDGMATNITTLRLSNEVDDFTYYQFGTIGYGVAVTKNLHVTYYGSRPATGVVVSGISAPFSILSNTCGDEVTADCDILVGYTGNGAGAVQQGLKITYDNSSYAAEDTHTVMATGAAQVTNAVLTVAAAAFGKQLVSTTHDLTVTVSKTGTQPATLVTPRALASSVFSFKGGLFPGTGGTCATTITNACTLVLTFTPVAAASYSDTLTLDYFNGSATTFTAAAVSGQGGNPANLVLSPATSQDFGTASLNQAIDRTITVTNAASNVTATSIIVSGLAAPFTQLGGCASLAPGNSCVFTYRFRPTTSGPNSIPITFSYFDGQTTRSDQVVTLTGTGTDAALLVSNYATYNFGNVYVGNTSLGTVTLTYYGGLPATLSSIGTLADPFSHSGGSFPGGGSCSATAISTTCTFRVAFAPTAAQGYSSTFVLNYDDGYGNARSLSVLFTGTGVAPSAPVLSFSPSAVAFGNIAVNSSATATVTVSRSGNQAATALVASGLSGAVGFLGGTYPGTGGTCGSTLSATTCTLVLRYAPTLAQSEAQTLALSYFNGTATNVVSLNVSGNGVHTASLAFSAGGAFGSLPVSATASQNFTLTNSGTGTATALVLSFPSGFSITSQDCGTSLAPLATCTLTLQFSSAQPGVFNGNLQAAYFSGLANLSATRALSARVTVPYLIAVNGDHSCLSNDIGQLKCWGQNNYGQLGLGDSTPRGNVGGTMGANLPAVALGTGRYAKSIALGYWHTCAILDNNSTKCWGNNSYGQLGLGVAQSKVGNSAGQMGDNLAAVNLGTGVYATKISAGYTHTCALLNTGRVKCWGQNYEGQLGLGDTTDRGMNSGEMGDGLPLVDLGPLTVTDLSVNTSHSCALLSDQTVKCWGNNFFGQLGIGDFANRGDGPGEMGNNLPVAVLGSGAQVQSLRTGGAFTCALLSSGSVKCWGRNEEGILGASYCQNSDGEVGSCADVNFPLALRGLGIAASHLGDALPSIDLGTGAAVAALTAANSSVCAQLSSGAVKCWGQNQYGQLGQGDTISRGLGNDMGDNLLAINLGSVPSISTLVSGGYHNCVLFAGGQTKCWGNNRFGSLGLGDTQARGDQPGELGNSLPYVSY